MITFHFVLDLLRSVNTLNSELKFKTILINKLKLLPTLYREATLTFLNFRFASKQYWTPLLRRFLFVSYTQLYVAYSKLCRGKLCKRKANHTLCLESLWPPCFWSFSKPLIFGLLRDAISTQIRWQDPWWSLRQVVRTSFWFHLRECMGSSLPPPPPGYFSRPFLSCCKPLFQSEP